ncbi:MAG TPA: PAS domain-containing sensor histidine kinase [Candidatus Limnocylindria bacterium]|nr:PAS domain-containing sensor histidine kinase [Candidatus Limnocylindria bacterium]
MSPEKPVTPGRLPADFGIGRLFNSVSDAVIVGDVESGTIVLWNAAAEALFGHTAAEALGQPLSLIVAESLRAQHAAGLARYRRLRTGSLVGRAKPAQVTARAKDGREFPVELTLSRIDEHPDALLAIVRDVSDREAVRAARALEQQRREFFAMASHELKTPLTSIGGFLQLTERHLARGRADDALAALAASRRRVDDMTRLVDELLDASRLEVGRFPVRPARIDLRSVVADVLARYGSEELGRIRQRIANVPVEVDADPLRIQQVAENLVSNALKYGAGRPVDVEVAAAAGQAVLRVRDRGIGIPEADRAQLFLAFYRTSNTANIGGTGLGLFISRRIAELHGGRVDLEASGPDGSTFALTLPLAE